MNTQEEVLYLDPLELSGPEQMAIDLFLLEKSFADQNFNMAIRFYTWDGDWLSIGKNQKELPRRWIELLEKKQLKDFIKNKKNITIACLDEITDPRNIGSIIRSAVSFGIDGIIIKERSFPSESKLLYKSASGAIENIQIFEVPNINTTLKYLRQNNFWVYGFDSNAEKDFTDIEWTGNTILLFGSEGYGIKAKTLENSDFKFKVDIDENIESLNISNSVSIVCHYIDFYLNKNE